MTKFYSSFLLTGLLFTLVACAEPNKQAADDSTDRMCVAGYVQNTNNSGTLEIYTKSGVIDEIQTMTDVSSETADDITEQLGVC